MIIIIPGMHTCNFISFSAISRGGPWAKSSQAIARMQSFHTNPPHILSIFSIPHRLSGVMVKYLYIYGSGGGGGRGAGVLPMVVGVCRGPMVEGEGVEALWWRGGGRGPMVEGGGG